MHQNHSFSMLKEQHGSAIIEMAIVLPIFILLFIAIVDFGLYFNKRIVAQSAAWNGAKAYAASQASGSSSCSSAVAIVTQTLAAASMDTDLVGTPSCSQPTGTYCTVTVVVTGGVFSPITSAVNLYDIQATGIAN